MVQWRPFEGVSRVVRTQTGTYLSELKEIRALSEDDAILLTGPPRPVEPQSQDRTGVDVRDTPTDKV